VSCGVSELLCGPLRSFCDVSGVLCGVSEVLCGVSELLCAVCGPLWSFAVFSITQQCACTASSAHVRLQVIEYLNISGLVIDFATSPVRTGNSFFDMRTNSANYGRELRVQCEPESANFLCN